MKTILENVTSEIIIQKSRFITKLIKIDSINSILYIIEDIKKEYKGATHYCYAYIFDQYKRFSDDGEPGGTAGMPILNVLENQNLNHILCVVIRYFGGIKLGAGGLVRAYTNSVTSTLEISTLKELCEAKKIHIIFTYNQSKIIDSLLKETVILEKKFDENIEYIFIINNNSYQDIISKLESITIKLDILDDLFI